MHYVAEKHGQDQQVKLCCVFISFSSPLNEKPKEVKYMGHYKKLVSLMEAKKCFQTGQAFIPVCY